MTRNGAPRPSRGTIAHVTTSLDIGGAQAMLAKLVTKAHLQHDGLAHLLVSLLPPGAFTPLASECSVYSLGMTRGRLPGPAATMRLLRIINRVRPDILQGWMYHGNLAASLVAMIRPGWTPVVWNVRHSLADPAVESRATRALLSVSARLSSRTVAILYNSQTAARQHEAYGFDAAKSVHIPNGFNCDLYKPDATRRRLLSDRFGIPDGRVCIAMIGRCHPMKDYALLVEATARAISEGQNLHLLLVGPGLETAPGALRSRINTLLSRDRVTISGARTDIAEWLPGVDIFALSSAWGEAFPNVLGEAMACGVPCIATDVGDSGWVIGDSGIVVPPRDAEAFAAAITRLCECGGHERRQRGRAARARIEENFELGEIADRYRQLYLSILRGKRAFSQFPSHPGGHRQAAVR